MGPPGPGANPYVHTVGNSDPSRRKPGISTVVRILDRQQRRRIGLAEALGDDGVRRTRVKLMAAVAEEGLRRSVCRQNLAVGGEGDQRLGVRVQNRRKSAGVGCDARQHAPERLLRRTLGELRRLEQPSGMRSCEQHRVRHARRGHHLISREGVTANVVIPVRVSTGCAAELA